MYNSKNHNGKKHNGGRTSSYYPNNKQNKSKDEPLKPIHFCKYCRGQVWWESNVPHIGSVQSSDRPVLIISDDTMNSVSSNVIVLPMTSKHKFISESNLMLPFNEKSSIVLGDQPRTVPKENLKNYLYTLSPELIDQAIRALLVSIGYISRTKGIHRMQDDERKLELDSEKQGLMTVLKKERDIIDAYIDGGIEHVTSVIGAGTSTAYKKLNAAIDVCKSCEVYLDLVQKAESKKANNTVRKKVADTTEKVDNATIVNPIDAGKLKNEINEITSQKKVIEPTLSITASEARIIMPKGPDFIIHRTGTTSFEEFNETVKGIFGKIKDGDFSAFNKLGKTNDKIVTVESEEFVGNNVPAAVDKIDKTAVYSDTGLIKRQLLEICNRGEMTQALREFKKNGNFIHPCLRQALEGQDKYNYLQTLYEIVDADPKLKKDIKKISTSLKYKIQSLKTKLEETQNGQILKSAT